MEAGTELNSTVQGVLHKSLSAISTKVALWPISRLATFEFQYQDRPLLSSSSSVPKTFSEKQERLSNMEHLLFAGGIAPIVFPFLDSESWDGGDFLSYPQRQGWDSSIWDRSDDEDRLDTHRLKFDDLATFLQRWLFFGLLETVLRKKIPFGDITRLVDDGDEDPRRVITTSRLAAYLDECRLYFTNISDDEKIERGAFIYNALSEARIVNHRLNYKIYLGDPCPNSDLL